MGVDTKGFTAKKSLNQVLMALVSIGYEVDKDVLASMNNHGMKNFYMIPITRKDAHRVISYGVYDSDTNGLSDSLPKTGRRLKNSKQFAHFSLGADRSAFQIIQGLVGALGGGYVQFMDTSEAPAIEVDEKGKLIDHNTLLGKKKIIKTLRDMLYFNIDNFKLLDTREAEKTFIPNAVCNYKPLYVYQRDNRSLYVLYVDKEGNPCISTVSSLSDNNLFRAYVEYGKNHKIFISIKDIAY